MNETATKSARGKKPELAWLPVDRLDVDARYQRSIESRRSQKLIDKMAAEFRWPRFGAILAVKNKRRWFVIDGQHRVAACKRIGETHVPAVVLPHGDVKEAARDFIAINRDRVNITPIHIHHAAVGTGDADARAVEEACRAAGVSIARFVTGVNNLATGETLAVGAINRIVKKHGVAPAAKILKKVMKLYGGLPGGIRASAIRDVEIDMTGQGASSKPASRANAKNRPCLRCRKPFWSSGPGHRVCDACKNSDVWRGAGLDA